MCVCAYVCVHAMSVCVCVRVCVKEVVMPPHAKHTHTQVLSTGIRDQSLLTIRNPIVYRIYTSDDVVSAMDDQ